jgi:cytochrome c
MLVSQGRALSSAIVMGGLMLVSAACAPAQAPAPTPPPASAAKPTTAPAAPAEAAKPTEPAKAAEPTPAGGAAAAKPNPAQVQQGQQLVAQKGCGGCHVVPGVAGANGAVGPSLAGVATRTPIAGGALPNTGPDDLKRWILDPPAAKPGTQMPKLGLTDDEASAIVAFLETLR